MKVSYNKLNEIHPFSEKKEEEVGRLIDSQICKVISTTKVGEVYDSIISAKILEIEKHPNADNLSLATVDTSKETIKVVCGAKNIEVGQIVPLITVGAKLPDGTKIKKAKIRGVESMGMLCSGAELNLSVDSEGILILDSSTKIGLPIGKILNLCDTIYELPDEYMAQNNCSFSLPEIRSKLAKILNENYPPLASTSENKKIRKSIFQSFVGWLRSLRVLQ